MVLTIDAKVWGPAFWTALHTASFAYPDEPTEQERSSMKAFIAAYASVLPCESCKQHFAELLEECAEEFEDALSTQSKLSRFVVDLHNKVNISIEKPTMAYIDVARTYENADDDGACPIYKRSSRTQHGAYYCETRPPILWGLLICTTILFVLIATRVAFRWHKVVNHCRKKCPSVARLA